VLGRGQALDGQELDGVGGCRGDALAAGLQTAREIDTSACCLFWPARGP
jgi:hypothetical protein